MSYENAFMQNDSRKMALEETVPLKFHISERCKEKDGRTVLVTQICVDFFLPCWNTFSILKSNLWDYSYL